MRHPSCSFGCGPIADRVLDVIGGYIPTDVEWARLGLACLDQAGLTIQQQRKIHEIVSANFPELRPAQ